MRPSIRFRPEFQFVSDSQDVKAIHESIGSDFADGFDSFFVLVGDGDYIAIYGMYGIVPYISKLVYQVFDNRRIEE